MEQHLFSQESSGGWGNGEASGWTFPGWCGCSEFSRMLSHLLLSYYRKGILSIGSFLEQVEEETEGEMMNRVHPADSRDEKCMSLLMRVHVYHSVAAAWCTGAVSSDVWCSGTDVAEHQSVERHQRAVWGQDEGLCPVSSGDERLLVHPLQYFVQCCLLCVLWAVKWVEGTPWHSKYHKWICQWCYRWWCLSCDRSKNG